MKKCLHQIIKPSRRALDKVNGVGECVDCKPDPEENEKCRKYTPVSDFTIIDEEDEED